MRKNIFHNDISAEKKLDKKNISHLLNIAPKRNVDINRLLNRVKTDKEDEKKKSFIFFGLGFLLLSLMGTFVTIIR